MKKSIPGKTPQEVVFEKAGSASGDNWFRGLLEGRFGADDPLGEKMCSVGRKGGVGLRLAEKQETNSSLQ